MKYSFAVQNRFGETLTVEGADSFDEAVLRVERGLTERDLVIGRRLVDAGQLQAIPEDIKYLLVKEGKIVVQPAPPTTAEPAPAATPEPAPAPEAPTPAPEAPATPETAPAPAQAAPETPTTAPEAPAAPQA